MLGSRRTEPREAGQLPRDSHDIATLEAKLLIDDRAEVTRLEPGPVELTSERVDRDLAAFMLNSIGDAIIATDTKGRVTYLNAGAESMTGFTCNEALARPFSDVVRLVDGTNRPCPDPMTMAMNLGTSVKLPPGSVLIRRDGVEFYVEDCASPVRDRLGDIVGAVMIFRDVAQSRALSQRMAHLAQHDFLTDLPNRLLLNDRLSHAIAFASRHHQRLAVLFVDMDHFKHVNDSLGHATGDQLLTTIAKRLVDSVRSSDTVSRHGGDEFIVLLSSVEDADDAALSAQRILAALGETHRVDPHDLEISASIGISVYPDDGVDAETLVQNADIAMLNSKKHGRNNYSFFKPQMNEQALERRFLETSLRHALDRHELLLYYQPKMDLKTETLVGVEALIRWSHPKRGIALPREFLPVAEQSGYMLPIGKWVLREACRQARNWLDAKLAPVTIAINISAAELLAKGFVDNIREALLDSSLEAQHLELEITETALMKDLAAATPLLHALRDLGVRLTLDHFGTGTSSLTCLKQLPIDALKIDRSLVGSLCKRGEDGALVSAVISMGRSLHLRVIAEGVETREQFLALRSQQCAQGQGHYFRQPVPAHEFARLLETDFCTTLVIG